jgi:hypothetical protein
LPLPLPDLSGPDLLGLFESECSTWRDAEPTLLAAPSPGKGNGKGKVGACRLLASM